MLLLTNLRRICLPHQLLPSFFIPPPPPWRSPIASSLSLRELDKDLEADGEGRRREVYSCCSCMISRGAKVCALRRKREGVLFFFPRFNCIRLPRKGDFACLLVLPQRNNMFSILVVTYSLPVYLIFSPFLIKATNCPRFGPPMPPGRPRLLKIPQALYGGRTEGSAIVIWSRNLFPRSLSAAAGFAFGQRQILQPSLPCLILPLFPQHTSEERRNHLSMKKTTEQRRKNF